MAIDIHTQNIQTNYMVRGRGRLGVFDLFDMFDPLTGSLKPS